MGRRGLTRAEIQERKLIREKDLARLENFGAASALLLILVVCISLLVPTHRRMSFLMILGLGVLTNGLWAMRSLIREYHLVMWVNIIAGMICASAIVYVLLK